jgi:hypothetical protein
VTLQYVTVTWDEQDIGAAPLGGYVSFQLTSDLQDTADGTDVRRSPAKTYWFNGPSGTSDPLAANDSTVTPSGSAYTVTVAIRGQQPVTFTTQINHANGATQTLAFLQASAALPVTQYAQYMPAPTGNPVAGAVPVATGAGQASAWSTGVITDETGGLVS